jgi:hypothetical protein
MSVSLAVHKGDRDGGELSGLLEWQHVAAAVENLQFGTLDVLGVVLAVSQWNELVLTAPEEEPLWEPRRCGSSIGGGSEQIERQRHVVASQL